MGVGGELQDSLFKLDLVWVGFVCLFGLVLLGLCWFCFVRLVLVFGFDLLACLLAFLFAFLFAFARRCSCSSHRIREHELQLR